MGIFKGIKKVLKKIWKPAAVIGATILGGPAGGLAAAGALLGAKVLKGMKPPDPADLPQSPMEELPEETRDAALREQETGQRAAGGAVSGGASDLLLEDEVKKRQLARTLLG